MKASDFIKLVDEENGSAPVAPEVPVAPAVPAPAPMPMADAPSAADFIRTFDIENDQRIADSGTTWDSVKDKGASLVAGAPALGKAVYDILRMATGDADWTVYGSNKYEQWRKDAIDALMSDAGKAKRRILERPLNDPNAGVSDVFTTALANPDAAVNMAVESMPTMLASAFGGGGTAFAAKTGAKLLGKELSKQALAKAATAGSIGTSAAMNAGDTFTSDAVQDLPMANRYQGAALSAALSAAAGKLLDGGAEGILARNMAGQGSKSGLVRGVLGGMAKEGGQEFIEEGGNAAGEQLAKREFNPNDILKRGTLGGMVGAIMGGPVGGLEGVNSRRQIANNNQQGTGTPTSSTLDALKVGSDTPVEPTQSERLVRPDAKIAKSNDSVVGEARRVGEAQVLPGSDRVVRVQNRDRSSDASVAQMTEIAARLDYGRLSPGRDFGNGAPVVAYGNVDEAHRGKTDYAVTADGERIPVQYAVVEATDVLTSNDASGNRVVEYQSAGPERMRAIAGNGRIAGVQRAYERGTAAKYRDEMTADYESFGVDPAVIEEMKAPVLVRIMPEDKIRTDVGSISNTSMNMDMSIVEKANDDAANIDFSTLEFDENGNPTDETVRQFVGRFPAGQAAGMMTGDGTISQQAKARFGAALFKKAYDNDQLTAIYAESTEGEAKNILNALAAVAGKMVRLEGGGDLDLRPIVAEAAEIIINARREGKTVAQYVADGSLGQSAEAAIVAEALDANKRSGKEMRRILSQVADDAFEAMSGQGLLIGEAKTREGIFENIRGEINAKKQQEQQSSDNQSAEAKHVEERGGASPAESNVQREAVEPAGQSETKGTGSSETVTEDFVSGDLKFSVSKKSPVVSVTTGAFESSLENLEALRKEVKKRLAEQYPEGTIVRVTVASDELEVLVSKRSALHSLGRRANWRTLVASLYLPQIVESAHRSGEWEENPHADEKRKDAEDIYGGWQYTSKIAIDGVVYPVSVRIVLHSDGENRLRHIKVQKTPDGYLEQPLHDADVNRSASVGGSFGKTTKSVAVSNDPIIDQNDNGAEWELKLSRGQEDWTPDNDLIERAKETFGVTRDVREAFYVLPDGTMLDGSGRHWGGDERDYAGQRQVDHGDISEVVDDADSAADAMYKWMAKTGAMRVDFSSGIASIARKPTRDQLSVLARASRGEYLALSFNTPEGRIVDDTEFESASAAKIQDFFDRALDMAARGIAGAFASKGAKKRGAQDAKTIVKTLEGDSDVGGAFNRLSSLGTVVVVSNTDNLPKRIRQALDQTKASTGIVTKHSDNGAIQGLYDTKNRVAYIIASNVTPETAKAVFLHEVGVHMGMDVLDDMKSLAMRARNMVNNGAKQGDATAMEVKRRMVDAGILSDVNEDIKPADAEEAFAYLVEVAAYADSRSPFRKWLDSVIARVKRWLNDHGIKLSIKPHEFVEIAMGNANALAGLKGRQLNAKETFKKSVIGKSVEKHLGGDWGKAIQLDATGRKKFAWGEHALVGGTNVALDVLEAAIPVLRTTYSIRYARPEVRRMIRDYAARCDAAVQEAGGVAKEMMKWSSDDRELLSDTIEGMLKTGTLPPQHVVEAAAKMSHLMTRQAQELVELGMLSEKSAARWRGHYLPRFYKERDPLFGEDWFKNLFKRSSTIRGVGGGSLKGRGCYKVVDSAAVKDFVKLGWEVRDARYEFNQKQGILVDSKDGKGLPTGVAVTIWRDWTPSERAQMGEIRDAGYRFTMGWMQMQRDIALGRMFKAIAENPELCSNLPGEGYSQVPDTEISETGGVKKYGALAGKYVRDDVLASIMPHAEVSSAFMRSYKKLLAYWKEGKTALNPVSHVNNCMGNIVMAHLAGVNMWNAKAYIDTILDIAKHKSWVAEAQKHGLYSGLFTREEIAEMLPKEFQKMLNSEKSAVARGADWVFTYVFNYGLRKGMRWLYEHEDKLFRLVIYKSALDRGLTPKEAVDYTLGFIPTYDDLPGGARAIRDTIIPFFSWTYKTIPTILLTAAKYPWRFAAVPVLLHTANALSYAVGAGDDDDDWLTRWKKGRKLAEAEEKLLPDYMRGYGAFANPKFIRMWTDETTGLPVYWNISNFVPGGQMFDVNNQAGGMPWPEMLNVSSPAYSTYCALFLNVDTFMGQPLTMDSDTGMEKAEKRAAYMWRQLAPAMAVGGYHYERIMNAMANATGDSVMGYTGVGRNGQAVTPLAAGLNTIGIKVRDVDFEQELQRRVAGILAEQREIQANIKHMAKLLNKGAVTAESAEEYKRNQKEKMKRSADKLKEVQDADKQRKENTRY